MAVAVAETRERGVVYPEERLPWPQTLLLGFQHVMVMFGATILVPLIVGFNPNTVVFFSGVATLIFLWITRGKVPSYLGSSFSFIGPILVIQGGPHGNHGPAYFGILATLIGLTRDVKPWRRAALVALFAVGIEWLRGREINPRGRQRGDETLGIPALARAGAAKHQRHPSIHVLALAAMTRSRVAAT